MTKVLMPKLSEAMETGKVIKWLKKEGDAVKGGDILAEVETDKADVEMEAFGAGVLRKILVPAGGKVPVGALIGVIAGPDDDISALLASAPASSTPAGTGEPSLAQSTTAIRREGSPVPAGPATTATPAAGMPAPPAASPRLVAPVSSTGRVKASPLARKVAAQSGVDLRLIQGSGPGGRIIRRDVEAASATGGARVAMAPTVVVTGPEYEDRPLSQMRAIIAKRMPLAKGPVPHFYVASEIAMDRAWELREEWNAIEGRPKLSVNDLVVRACAVALLQHPGVNASFQGETIRVWRRAHIGIAVALEDGLITPVLRDAHAKSLAQIAVESRDLAERARARKLRMTELSGATFSISNLGMFDVAEFSAIINPPEGAILAVGAVRRVPVAGETGVTVGRLMMLTLSCDHRVMDGAMGARFLQDVRRLLEQPLRLVL
ncbi:MAG: dihydrolipoamide acetyltransferase family protein [Candidatus Rokuibacteriota bacterium]